jgi:hypothetical protein
VGCGFAGGCGFAVFFGLLGFTGCGGVLAEFGGEFVGGEGLDGVADLDVFVAGEIDAGLDALRDWGFPQ